MIFQFWKHPVASVACTLAHRARFSRITTFHRPTVCDQKTMDVMVTSASPLIPRGFLRNCVQESVTLLPPGRFAHHATYAWPSATLNHTKPGLKSWGLAWVLGVSPRNLSWPVASGHHPGDSEALRCAWQST